MNAKLTYLVGFFGAFCLAFAQDTVHAERFEIASVKPVHGTAEATYFRFHHGGIIASNLSVATLLVEGFGLHKEDQIVNAPKWVFSEKFDVQAKPQTEDIDVVSPEHSTADRTLSAQRTEARLRFLLNDRFQLRSHESTREIKGYALIVAKGGAKFLLTKLKDESETGRVTAFEPGRYAGQGISMALLANTIGRVLGVPVANQTNLAGFYKIDLSWAPDEA